jgi:hypothetical protein
VNRIAKQTAALVNRNLLRNANLLQVLAPSGLAASIKTNCRNHRRRGSLRTDERRLQVNDNDVLERPPNSNASESRFTN